MKTVFVVGAGASTEFQLPLGIDLVIEICDQLKKEFLDANGEGPLRTATEQLPDISQEKWLQAARYLYGGLLNSNSIDQFLHTHREREVVRTLGRMAIIARILAGEHRCNNRKIGGFESNFVDARNGAAAVVEFTWLGRLFRLLTEGFAPDNIGDAFNDVAFVTFNYDRCIEYFLYYLLVVVGCVEPADARQILESVSIVHAYGSIGALPEQQPQPSIAFGAREFNPFTIAQAVKTFRDQDATTGAAVESIRDIIRAAERIVFLGFSYAPENMQLLFSGDLPNAQLTGTRFKMSESDFKQARRLMLQQGKIPTTQFVDSNCVDFVRAQGELLSGRSLADKKI